MKTFFNNNYGVSIICNEFTQGVELAVLLGNKSQYIILDEEVYSGLSDANVDEIMIDVSSRKPLSNAEVTQHIDEYRKLMQEYERESRTI